MNDILSQILINKANELKKSDKNITPLKRQNNYDFFDKTCIGFLIYILNKENSLSILH